MKKRHSTILLMLLLTVAINSNGQTPSLGLLKGNWVFIANNKGDSSYFSSYRLFRGNKSIDIFYFLATKQGIIRGTPFSYFGFWNTQRPNYPNRVIELDSVGTNIFFYDDLGQNYDRAGNLLRYSARTCWMSYNEDEEPKHEPAILRFYQKGIPDVYVRAKAIPDSILLALKQNPKSWKNYADFVGMSQKKVRTKQAIIYQSPDSPTKAYLIAGDEVEVLETTQDWYRIRYYSKKVTEGWIRRVDTD